MFEVDFSELMVIAVVALIVLGPERLPKAARMLGSFVRKARASFDSLKAEVERELEAEELKKRLANFEKEQTALVNTIQQPLQDAIDGMQDVSNRTKLALSSPLDVSQAMLDPIAPSSAANAALTPNSEPDPSIAALDSPMPETRQNPS